MRHIASDATAPVRRKALSAGSLLGDLAEVAHAVHLASRHFDVTVWSNADAEIYFDRAERSPAVDPQYLAGTYGVGSVPSDIESDLLILKVQCVSSAIIQSCGESS